MGLYIFLFWILPTLCVEAWVEKFIKDTEKDPDYDACLHYEQLSTVFSPFLMLFYSLLQWMGIIISFASIVKIVNPEPADFNEYLTFFGYAIALGEQRLFYFFFHLKYNQEVTY